MKITKQELKQLIKEEVDFLLNEQLRGDENQWPYEEEEEEEAGGGLQPTYTLASPEYEEVLVASDAPLIGGETPQDLPCLSDTDCGDRRCLPSGECWEAEDTGPQGEKMYNPESEEGYSLLSLLKPAFYQDPGTGTPLDLSALLGPEFYDPATYYFRESKRKK